MKLDLAKAFFRTEKQRAIICRGMNFVEAAQMERPCLRGRKVRIPGHMGWNGNVAFVDEDKTVKAPREVYMIPEFETECALMAHTRDKDGMEESPRIEHAGVESVFCEMTRKKGHVASRKVVEALSPAKRKVFAAGLAKWMYAFRKSVAPADLPRFGGDHGADRHTLPMIRDRIEEPGMKAVIGEKRRDFCRAVFGALREKPAVMTHGDLVPEHGNVRLVLSSARLAAVIDFGLARARPAAREFAMLERCYPTAFMDDLHREYSRLDGQQGLDPDIALFRLGGVILAGAWKQTELQQKIDVTMRLIDTPARKRSARAAQRQC